MIMHRHASLTFSVLQNAAHSGDNVWFCLCCGECYDEIRSDERYLKCEDCGKEEVCSASDILFEMKISGLWR